MQEIDVLRATRRFLQQRGLMGSRVIDLFTDAHPSLLGASDLRPFQRFTLAFDGFAVHPISSAAWPTASRLSPSRPKATATC